jgi:hypothetical protein
MVIGLFRGVSGCWPSIDIQPRQLEKIVSFSICSPDERIGTMEAGVVTERGDEEGERPTHIHRTRPHTQIRVNCADTYRHSA